MDNPLVINDLGRAPCPRTAGAGVLGVSVPLASLSTASRRPSRLPTTVKLGFKMRPGWKVLSSTAAIRLPGAGGRVRAKTGEELCLSSEGTAHISQTPNDVEACAHPTALNGHSPPGQNTVGPSSHWGAPRTALGTWEGLPH